MICCVPKKFSLFSFPIHIYIVESKVVFILVIKIFIYTLYFLTLRHLMDMRYIKNNIIVTTNICCTTV